MSMMLSVLILTMFLSLPPLSSSADPSQECGSTAQDSTTTPIFLGSLHGVTNEDYEVGSFTMDIEAVSGDGSSYINYELIENPGNYFALNQTTGRLTTARQLDRVAPTDPFNVLVLTVRASASNGKFKLMEEKLNEVIIFFCLLAESSTIADADVTIFVEKHTG